VANERTCPSYPLSTLRMARPRAGYWANVRYELEAWNLKENIPGVKRRFLVYNCRPELKV
jgi:hypothetical protein